MATPRRPFADWSWTIGKLAGITIRIHPTFLILLAWVAISDFIEGQSLFAAVDGVVFLCFLFAIVVLHEMAHALTARRFGVATRDITLLPIGGVSSLERIPEKPGQEFLVAFAGPALNFVLAGVFFGIGALLGQSALDVDVGLVRGSMVERLAWANVTLAVFNLIPAFPMDGGRVLRSLLALKWDRDRATRIAASVGHFFAVAIGLVGLLVNPILLFIAWFVWVGATQEASVEHTKSLLHGFTAQNAMVTSVRTLAPTDPIDAAAAVARESFQNDYPVVVGDHAVGILSRKRIYEVLSGSRAASVVGDVMEPAVTSAPEEPLDDLVLRLGESEARAAVVVDHDHFAGLVTQEKLADLVVAQSHRHIG
jgi:Zn-dependent protease/CBS domain-containing protein